MVSSTTSSIRMHRILRAPVERVYKAFIDADALCRWLPPFGFVGKIHHMDAKEGGSYRMSFINFSKGEGHSFESTFVELVPNERIRIADKFEIPGFGDQMTKLITFNQVACGTEIEILHENIPAVIPGEMCCLGWQESLLQLANLVEPNIP